MTIDQPWIDRAAYAFRALGYREGKAVSAATSMHHQLLEVYGSDEEVEKLDPAEEAARAVEVARQEGDVATTDMAGPGGADFAD